MKSIKYLSTLVFATCFSFANLSATIKLTDFTNHSDFQFKNELTDGRNYQQLFKEGDDLLIDQKGTEIVTTDGNFKIIFEDAEQSGYHRPHWKYHVWIETTDNLPFFAGNRILYAVIFYDDLGEVKLIFDEHHKLHLIGGVNVKDVLYPWEKGTIGRGNPYHEINGQEADENGIQYFDFNGFIAIPENYLID